MIGCDTSKNAVAVAKETERHGMTMVVAFVFACSSAASFLGMPLKIGSQVRMVGPLVVLCR